jgi:hypothetical protein
MRSASPRDRRLPPTSVAAAMFTRELLRRWPTVLFMVFLPASYFIVSYVTSDGTTTIPLTVGDAERTVLDRDVKALYLAVLGISVTSSFAALHSVQNSKAAMQRLRLCGMPVGSLLLARTSVLLAVMALASAVFIALFAPLVTTRSLPLTLAALLTVSAIGVGLGTLVGLVIPREFEGAMVLIAVAGVQMALGRGGSEAERFLPYWPGVDALKSAVFAPDPAAGSLALGCTYAALLLGVAAVIWITQTRIRRPERSDR